MELHDLTVLENLWLRQYSSCQTNENTHQIAGIA